MPLSEFLRMARGKLESAQQKSCPTDLCSRSENDLVELVWENGQIVMQGQSSRVTQNPNRNNLPSKASRVRDAGVGHATTSRFGKFGGVESILNDMAPVVPSRDLDLSQDDEMAPWLSYPMDDALGQDYVSELLPEISGVTANGMSTQNSFVSVDKRSNCEQTVDNLHSGGNALKASSSKDRLLSLWTPQHRQTSDGLVSGVSDIVSNNTSNHMDSSKKMEKQNIQPPTNNSNFLNFSHFSRPANLVKANLVKANLSNTDEIHASVSSGVERMEIKGKLAMVERVNSTPKDTDFHGPPATVSLVKSREPVANISKESCPPERTDNLCQETSMKNDKPLTMSNADNSTKGVPDGEKTVEPMVASSSVGSGNSADRVSCEHTHNSKRKFRDMEESECRSDDVDTESLDAKKRTPVRGSKRSRAAEVHNLSERRRRDRINEKMRALQELIPNCNKADKASMLDEAIEYLKTLQLQVQMMSMGAGLCMSPVMFPTRMQHMHPTHFPHFPPMGVGMGPGMGYGMGMLDINGGSSGCPIFHVPRMQVPYFPPPVSGITNFQRIPSPNLPLFGLNSVPRAPFVPFMGQPPVTSAIGLTALRNGTNGEVPSTSPVMNPRDPVATMNSQLMRNAEVGCSINDKSNQLQARKDVSDQPAAVPENKQGTDARGPTSLTSTTKTDTNKKPGCD